MTDQPAPVATAAARRRTYPGAVPPAESARPELADVGRLGGRLVRWAVGAARREDHPLRGLLHKHLGPGASGLPIVSGSWLQYDHVNLQVGLDAWLAQAGRQHELVGITGFHHHTFGLADLVEPGRHEAEFGMGNVATVAMPSGPHGRTHSCVQCGIYLVSDGDSRLAMLMRAPEHHDPFEEVSLEVAAGDAGYAERVVAEIRQLAVERNVFRGQVISFGSHMFGHGRGVLLNFVDRPQVAREHVVLAPELLDGIERQVLGVQRHAGRLLASGQHLKRGVLLHGAPGTGKTHTIGYLLGQMPQATIVILSGMALQMIGQACSVARLLQPSVIVVEDVDLIAEQRMPHMGWRPLLFQLLNEMDGLGEDVDVTFLLTTNRADLLEEALAARPGRVDHAAQLPIPDAAARQRLLRLYQGGLVLDLSDPDTVIRRTEGVTASFLKELLRKAALFAAEDGAGAGAGDGGGGDDGGGAAVSAAGAGGAGSGADAGEGAGGAGLDGALRVTDAHMNAALDQLLDTRNQLTRSLLGGQAGDADAPGRPARSLDTAFEPPGGAPS